MNERLVQALPPFPDEDENDIARSKHAPITDGAEVTTTGLTTEALVVTVIATEGA